jgi:type I restriction enzyme S subunit
MSEWKECKLGGVAEFKNGKSRPPEVENGTIPIYGGNGILGYTDIYNYQDPTVIVGRVGAYCGSVFYENKPIWISDNALYTIPKNRTDAKFLFYLLKNMDLNFQAEGSSHPLLTQTLLNSLEVFITDSPSEQRAIAGVLSSLDDKIDLLHRQNKTLEGMAEALWQKMFVEDTDPDWKRGKLGDYGQIICGKTPSKKVAEYFGGHIPFIKIPDMHGNVFIFETEDSLTETGVKSQQSKTIPAKSICVSCIATVGLVCMNAVDSQTNQQINTIVPNNEFQRYFLFLVMRNMTDDLLARASGGTATDNLNTGDFSRIEISKPPENDIQKFDDLVRARFDKIYANQIQIRTLSRLRDTLLPKLISGEVRVKEN